MNEWYLFVPVAGGMAVATAGLVRLAAHARERIARGVVLFLFAMMAEMFAGAVSYYLLATPSALLEALWGTGLAMAATAVPVFLVSLRETGPRRSPATVPARDSRRADRSFRAAVILLVLLSETLMGWAFELGTGSALGAFSVGGGYGLVALGQVLVSPWFVFSMAAEMAITLLLLRPQIARELQVLLGVQSLLMALTPASLPGATWSTGSTEVGSAVMIGLFVYLMEYIYRHRNLDEFLARYLVRVLAVYGVMMAGLFVWFQYGAPELLGVGLALEMAVYFDAVLTPAAPTASTPFVWQLSSAWAFALLSSIFVAELFMGAVLDLQLDPGQFAGTFFAQTISGGTGPAVGHAISDGFWFVADVCASTWFLAMMGVEMGALVVFKLRETRQFETRLRLVLMMGCYATFAVFYPSIYFGLVDPGAPPSTQVPVLGWSMGIGSAPLAAGVFTALLLTYAVTGSLSALFGRRVICSTFCTAPLMYQGTAIDAMGSFNRTGRIGRKYLGSRFSTAYTVTTGVTMASLAVASGASYLDQVGRLHWTIGGTDPTVFLFAFYFSVLWYVMFVTIPYTGNYNCVTMGYCYTGAIAQAFHRIGFFKLKVRDREVCKSCTTLDCAKACPIGLVDMPGHFRTKGEFRNSKCCGVGDCIGACPYDNMYISDVRHWIRRQRGLPEVPPVARRLPMAPIPPATVGLQPAPGEAHSPLAARPGLRV